MKNRHLVGCGAAVAATAALWVGAAESTAQDGPSTIDEARTALSELVDVRRTLSQEKSRWFEERQLLEERITVAERKLASLRELIDTTQLDIGEADEGVAELEAEAAALEAASTVLEEPLPGLEARVLALLERVPAPAREEVRFLSQSIPGAQEENDAGQAEESEEDAAPRKKLSSSQRFQSVVGVMTRLDKFNAALHVATQNQVLSTGEQAQAKTLFLGLGQGYYVTKDGSYAGIGTANGDEWTWVPMDGAAEVIDQAMAIEQNSLPAAFVPLPLRIGSASTSSSSAGDPPAENAGEGTGEASEGASEQGDDQK